MRSQGISNHDIDYVEPNQFGPRTLRVNCVGLGSFPTNLVNIVLVTVVPCVASSAPSHYLYQCWFTANIWIKKELNKGTSIHLSGVHIIHLNTNYKWWMVQTLTALKVYVEATFFYVSFKCTSSGQTAFTFSRTLARNFVLTKTNHSCIIGSQENIPEILCLPVFYIWYTKILDFS